MKKHVVVGVTGGIACYKAVDVVSRLKKQGLDVEVIMTKNACEFVQPLTFQTLSQNLVLGDMFEKPVKWDVEHIEIAKKADLFLIVPATANFIGKVASGIADDFLTTSIMATEAKVVVAPAMNTNMYENKIVQINIDKLKSIGYDFIEPASGLLACGDTGKGKCPEPEDIVKHVMNVLNEKKDMIGKKVLVTAGPTLESIDPVRFISNHSSGKMGYAIAENALKRGAEVILVSGPVSITCSVGIKRIDVKSTEDMFKEVDGNYDWADIVIKAAAPADYKPAKVYTEKIKKVADDFVISLERNPDILLELGKKKGNKILVGFAAETTNLYEYAKGKIEKKNLDFIVANDVSAAGAGFKGDTNIVKIIESNGNITEYDMMTKKEVAEEIINKVVEYINITKE